MIVVFPDVMDGWILARQPQGGVRTRKKKKTEALSGLGPKQLTGRRLASAIAPAGRRAEASSSCPSPPRAGRQPQLQWSSARASKSFPAAVACPQQRSCFPWSCLPSDTAAV